MDSARLLVIDQSPESAQELTSLLRNSGINIRIEFANTSAEAEKRIKSDHPLLVIYNAGAPAQAPVSKILHIADRLNVRTALRFPPEDTTLLTEALTFSSCYAINSEQDDQLITVVRSLLEGQTSGRAFEDQKQKLDELQSRYNLLLDSSHESIAYIHEGLHVYANRAYLELLGARQFAELGVMSMLEIMHSDESDLKDLLRDMIKGEYPDNAVKVSIRGMQGGEIAAELFFSPARYEGEECIQMMVREIDASTALKDELERLRKTDPVTQLANRKRFCEVVNQFIELGRNSDGNSAVFYLEADEAGNLHDRLGVSDWDLLMVEMAGVIRSGLDDKDIAARFNDRGFTILASRGDLSELRAAANGIVKALKKHVVEIGGEAISTACSMGMAIAGPLARNADETVSHARLAFVQAARDGNCVKRYRPQVEATDGNDDQPWVERIRHALDSQDFYSVQHSIVNLEGDFEGLFENRTFMREEEGDVPAEQFMPIAERNNLGATIDKSVTRGLMKSIAGTGDRHIVSLSGNSVTEQGFAGWFRQQIEETGVHGSQLVIQLPAPFVEANLQSARRMLDELSDTGCTFSLSSFDDQRQIRALLDHLDIALVKLKTGLSDGLTNNSAHQDIVRSVVEAAEKRDSSVIADEVHDASDLAALWQCGVKLVAGDFLRDTPQVVGQ